MKAFFVWIASAVGLLVFVSLSIAISPLMLGAFIYLIGC